MKICFTVLSTLHIIVKYRGERAMQNELHQIYLINISFKKKQHVINVIMRSPAATSASDAETFAVVVVYL